MLFANFILAGVIRFTNKPNRAICVTVNYQSTFAHLLLAKYQKQMPGAFRNDKNVANLPLWLESVIDCRVLPTTDSRLVDACIIKDF